jgi:hypothetical protein
MERDSPGTEMLTRVVRSDWISKERKLDVGMKMP